MGQFRPKLKQTISHDPSPKPGFYKAHLPGLQMARGQSFSSLERSSGEFRFIRGYRLPSSEAEISASFELTASSLKISLRGSESSA